MYQYYYSKQDNNNELLLKDDISNYFNISKVRVTMWEEHCLECSAPLCYETCPNYVARIDGRCKLFENSISEFQNEHAENQLASRIKFRRWANLLTLVFPRILSIEEYKELNTKIRLFNKPIEFAIGGLRNPKLMWSVIRPLEYIRRKYLLNGSDEKTDAFILHCYNHKEPINLFLEIFDRSHNSLYKTSFFLERGENIFVLPSTSYNEACDKSNNIVKLYPENNANADISFLWCNFVKGTSVVSKKPAEKVKCVVWDLDNTIWNGILIETDDPKTLELRSGVLNLIKALDERGIIQSIASKNDFEPAMEILKHLKIDEYFIYPEINWGLKSDSLITIAKNLNINVDTFAFIDDSVFERESIKMALPQVRVFEENNIESLLELDCFNVPVTDDSKKRRQMYRTEEKRNKAREESKSNVEEFLKKCEIQISVFNPYKEVEKLRCYELVQRTNQLNMSGVKYDIKEFEKVVSLKEYSTFAFSCKDLFGEYGIVGFCQYKVIEKTLVFTEFAMSCRVAGKFIESALFSYLLKDTGVDEVLFRIKITEKNSLLRKTLEDIGLAIKESNESEILYSFSESLKNYDIVRINDEREIK